MKEIKFTKMDWEAPEVRLKRRRFVKIKENPSTGLYCYRHECLDCQDTDMLDEAEYEVEKTLHLNSED